MAGCNLHNCSEYSCPHRPKGPGACRYEDIQMPRAAIYILTTLCLNGTLPWVDFMDVTMEGIQVRIYSSFMLNIVCIGCVNMGELPDYTARGQ